MDLSLRHTVHGVPHTAVSRPYVEPISLVEHDMSSKPVAAQWIA